VWVAEGVYRPAVGPARDSSFVLPSGVRLFGGFSGQEADIAQRDWQAHPTLLSGDIGAQGDSADNSYTILYMENPDSGTVLDGFTLRHGIADNPDSGLPFTSPKKCGGALYVMAADGWAYPDVQNCVFERNYAFLNGGAVYVNGTGAGSVAPRFLNCVFRHNRARINGGAVYRDGSSWAERRPDFGGCVFEGNWANRRGGGLFFNDRERSDTFDLTGCKFLKNSVNMDEGGGAALNLGRLVGSNLRVKGCEFEENSAPEGAAFAVIDFSILYTSSIVIDSSVFHKNSTAGSSFIVLIDQIPLDSAVFVLESSSFTENFDAGIMNSIGGGKTILFKGCVFIENNVPALLGEGSSLNTIIENNFVYNSSPLSGFAGFNFNPFIVQSTRINNNIFLCKGGIFAGLEGKGFNIHSNVVDCPEGMFLYIEPNSSVSVASNTVNAKVLMSYNSSTASYAHCYNNIFLRNGEYLEYFPSNVIYNLKADFSHCLFDTTGYCDYPAVTCGPGNLFGLDPLFVNPDSGDYRLQPCSPLRDAGSNAAATGIPTDIAGAPRIQGGTVDIGAYESPAFGLAAEPSVKAACDSLANGSVSVPLAGACEPLDVSWQSGNQTGTSLDSLAPGPYAVTVTDSKGHSVAFNASVPAAPSPTLQVDGQPVSCFGAADASLSVKPLTGQPPFAYLWSPPVTMDSVATGLGPGPVSVTVTDDWGCTATFSLDVPQPDTLQFAATVTAASSPQAADGSILVNNVMGGTAPYGYLWEPGGSTDDMIANLLPGLYTLTVTDERGCEAVWTFEVKAVSGTGEAEGKAVLIIYPNPAREAVTLTADFKGTAVPARLELFDAAGRLARSLSVSDNGGAWQIPLEGLAAGQYLVSLKDKNGETVGAGALVKK
jgi:predicted outer membrane repeat protein